MISELKTFYRIYADTRNENTGKIVAKQNDTKTRYLDITVTDNGVPVDLTGCEVRIYGRKKDGTEFYNEGTLQDATTGRCLFEATTQMLAYAGQNVNCEIVVFKDNEQILSTMPFDIFVVESLMGASAIESSNEYGALVILYQNLYEAIDLMTKMVQNIGSPSTVAEQYNLETMWQAWEFLVAYMKGDLTTKIDNALANSSVQGVLDELDNVKDILTVEHNVDVFDMAGTYTWTCHEGINVVTIIVVGAGGGGGGGGGGYKSATRSCRASGGSGGGGGAVFIITRVVCPGKEYEVIVGAGGLGGKRGTSTSTQSAQTDGENGESGGLSSFDGLIARGGDGGGGGPQASSSGDDASRTSSAGSGGTTIVIGEKGESGTSGKAGEDKTNTLSAGGKGGKINSLIALEYENGTGGDGGAGGKGTTYGSNGSAGKDGLVLIIY